MRKLLTAFFLIMITGYSTSEYVNSLKCHYNSMKNVSDTRVWCKRDLQDENCCTGFAFRSGITTLENNNIKISYNEDFFDVSISTLTQGEGVYWCGLMDKDKKSIIKLGEDYFYTPLNFIWSILRWIIFLLLALMLICTYIYTSRKSEKENNTYEDIMMRVKE